VSTRVPSGDRVRSGVGSGRQGGEVAEMQRRRLLVAIVEVVGEGGIEATTVGRVCERASVSRRTFYALFADREQCLLAAFDTQVQQLSQLMATAYAGRGRWAERVRSALVVLLDQFDSNPALARLCVIETPRAGPLILQRRREVLEDIARRVDDGRGEARKGSEPPPLTAQGIVGGVLSVIHTHLSAGPQAVKPTVAYRERPLIDLIGQLMAMIVHPYQGVAAARKELALKAPAGHRRSSPHMAADPFKDLSIRFTYRTARVLSTIASEPGASNRHVAVHAEIADEGQTSRLLARLQKSGLIENRGEGHAKGEPNAWALTPRGQTIHATIATSA